MSQAIIKLPRRVIPSDRPQALLGLYVKKVLVQLNLTLVNKSDTYTDPFLKAIFRLNNNVHILRSITGSGQYFVFTEGRDRNNVYTG